MKEMLVNKLTTIDELAIIDIMSGIPDIIDN